MPHQCVHCGKIYKEASAELIKGCPCGSHFFFFFKEKSPIQLQQEAEELTKELSSKEKDEIEDDVRDIIGDIDDSKPIILDFESIRVKEPGKFEIDIVNLFRRDRPLIYKLEEGKYIIDLSTTLKGNVKDLKEIRDPDKKED